MFVVLSVTSGYILHSLEMNFSLFTLLGYLWLLLLNWLIRSNHFLLWFVKSHFSSCIGLNKPSQRVRNKTRILSWSYWVCFKNVRSVETSIWFCKYMYSISGAFKTFLTGYVLSVGSFEKTKLKVSAILALRYLWKEWINYVLRRHLTHEDYTVETIQL